MPPNPLPQLWSFSALTRTDRALLALVFVAVGLYFFGLDSPYAPTTGDEMVYLHIARLTAESGHWLPLQSELADMRNTKPPLLIWQAMLAGTWSTPAGHPWSLWALRLPSVLYTLATTGLLAFFAYHLSGRMRSACLAAALYLLFLSSFRYGRVYLTSAPETFWLALPMWWLLWLWLRPEAKKPGANIPGWASYSAWGVFIGLGAAYKSFALVVPTAASLWCALVLSLPTRTWRSLWPATLGVTWSALLGLAIFSLWLLLDPDPGAVWKEFVLGENASKLASVHGYWHDALWGTYPMWIQLLAYPANAGLLAPAVLGCGLLALRTGWRRATGAALTRVANVAPTPALASAAKANGWRLLLLWLLVWLLVFALPSQRSERYLIPAMPALAIAMALVWERIPRAWFAVTLLLVAPALVLLARIAWVMGDLQIASNAEVAMTLIAVCAGLVCVAAGFYHFSWMRGSALAASAALYASFGLMVQPLAKAELNYPTALQNQLRGQRIAVPNGFNGQFERFQFVLPGARITPYDAEGRNTGALYPELAAPARLDKLLQEFDAVVWLQGDLAESGPSCLSECTLLGSRWHIKSRHQDGEITWGNLWQAQQWLFRREWLVRSTVAPPAHPVPDIFRVTSLQNGQTEVPTP